MPRHDSIFKALLRRFFADLLWLVVPDLAGQLDLAHPQFLDKEFSEAYLELNSEEEAGYARLAKVQENWEVRAMATTWSERIEAKGREEGLQEGLQAMRRVLLHQLEQRFGPLPESTRQQVEAISSLSRLTRLCERVLTARSIASLRLH